MKRLGPLLIAFVFVALAIWSWRKWPDPIVDFGRELYVPWQLAEGKVLYRDIAYFNGPLSPYLNAAAFRVFGVSLTTIILLNLSLLAGLTALLYRAITEWCDRFTATVACLLLLLIFGFGQQVFIGNYNYVCPYAHEMTHGIFLATLMIYLLTRHLRRQRWYWITGAGLCLGLVFLGKPEIFLAAAVAAGGALYLLARGDSKAAAVSSETAPTPATKIMAIVAFCASAFVPVLFSLVFLTHHMPIRDALHGISGAWSVLFNSPTAGSAFYRFHAGTDRPLPNLGWLVLGAVVFAGFVGLGILSDRALTRRGLPLLQRILLVPPAEAGRLPLASWAILLVGLVAGVWLLGTEPFFSGIGRPLPMIAVAAGVLAWRQRATPILIWSLFSFVLLAKIGLNVRLAHYGFVLAMPATLLVVMSTVGLLPRLLQGWHGGGRTFRVLAAAGLVGLSLFFARTSEVYYREKQFVVGTNGDRFFTYRPDLDPRSEALAELLAYVRDETSPEARLVVLPEGIMVNYLTRRASSVPYTNFMPPEFAIYGEDAMLRALEQHPPEYIVLIHKDTREYGVGFFGADPGYGERMMIWVRQHYEMMKQVGAAPLQGERFGIQVLRRLDGTMPD